MILAAYFWTIVAVFWIACQLVLIAILNATIKNPDRALIAYGLANGALILLLAQVIERSHP